jgi:hypothetical protein
MLDTSGSNTNRSHSMFSEWSEVEDQLRGQGFDVGKVKRELVRGYDLDRNLAELRQRQVAGKVNTTPHHPINGLGNCVARIDTGSYFYWAMREGPECWADKQFMREFLRDNESVRVRNEPRTATIIRP